MDKTSLITKWRKTIETEQTENRRYLRTLLVQCQRKRTGTSRSFRLDSVGELLVCSAGIPVLR